MGARGNNGRRTVAASGIAALLMALGGCGGGGSASVTVTANKAMGPLSADAVKDLAFEVTAKKLDEVKLTLDGQAVSGSVQGERIVFRPGTVSEGKHTFAAAAGKGKAQEQAFELDTTAPVVKVDKPDKVEKDAPFTLTGAIEGATAVKVDDKDVTLSDGRFSVAFAKAPPAVKIWATDAAGNISEQTVSSGGGGGIAGVRAAHIMSYDWATAEKHDPILQLIKEKKLDAVQLDIKDEDGLIGYDSQIPLAKAAGTAHGYYDAAKAVEEIHAAGAKVIGRIVAFRDPHLGKWAMNNGHMDYIIQNTSGGPYAAGNYGVAAFTNFANPDVIEYNVALGEEAAKLGFDGIMYDYLRKPENTGQVYPGIGDRTPSQALVDFVATAAARIRAAGATAGAAVFGVAAFTPTIIAQDVVGMAKHLDFISPMSYPSHWGKGEYSVDSPVNQPYDIVKRNLMDFNRLVLGTDCMIIPWIQNFSWPVPYTASDVGAQIRAAKDVGINSFYLWNDSSKVGLGAPALEARDASTDAPGELVYSINKPGNSSEGTKDAAKAKAFIDSWLAYVDGGRQGTFVAASTSAATSTASAAPAP